MPQADLNSSDGIDALLHVMLDYERRCNPRKEVIKMSMTLCQSRDANPDDSKKEEVYLPFFKTVPPIMKINEIV